MKLEESLLNTPGVLNFSSQADIEISNKLFTPIYINMEQVLNYPELREQYIGEMVKFFDPSSTVICGLESGGTYFASAFADRVNRPLIMIRRRTKIDTDVISKIVGKIPTPQDKICFIDDVISTGTTVSIAENVLSEAAKCQFTQMISAFSFGFEADVSKELNNLKINSASSYPTLKNIIIEKNILQSKDLEVIEEYISHFKNFLAEKSLINP